MKNYFLKFIKKSFFNYKPLIVAEIGSFHGSFFGNAKKLIKLAAKCVADCFKFKTHTANEKSLPNDPNPNIILKGNFA